MNVIYKLDDKSQFIHNDGITYLLGSNQSGKSFILSLLKDGFEGKYKDFSVNNLVVDKNEYNVIFLDDVTDFNDKFKFTKNNVFRDLIYSSVLNNINETKILKEVNELFDKIDTKVNQFLDININKKQDEIVRFDIDVTDINDIIDKFTNIYIDNYLIKEGNIPRSTKRKLIYNLLLFELKKSNNVDNVVIIDNFDLYLDCENTIKIINKLKDYHLKNPSTYFFLSSSNNLYELIDDKSSIYHVENKNVYHIDKLDKVIEEVFLRTNYENSDKQLSFDEYVNNNSELFYLDIKKKINEVLCWNQYDIGKIYVSNKVNLSYKYIKKDKEITIYCKNRFYYYLYEEIYNRLHDID